MRFITSPLVILLILAIVSWGSVDAQPGKHRWRNAEIDDASGISALSDDNVNDNELADDANDNELADDANDIASTDGEDYLELTNDEKRFILLLNYLNSKRPRKIAPPPVRITNVGDNNDCNKDVKSKRCTFDDEYDNDDDDDDNYNDDDIYNDDEDFDDDEEDEFLYSDVDSSPNRRQKVHRVPLATVVKEPENSQIRDKLFNSRSGRSMKDDVDSIKRLTDSNVDQKEHQLHQDVSSAEQRNLSKKFKRIQPVRVKKENKS